MVLDVNVLRKKVPFGQFVGIDMLIGNWYDDENETIPTNIDKWLEWNWIQIHINSKTIIPKPYKVQNAAH